MPALPPSAVVAHFARVSGEFCLPQPRADRDFFGTAGQVLAPFHTEIHHLEVNGVHYIANMSKPRIPAALAPAVAGLVSLHDFHPHPMMMPRGQYRSRQALA